MEESTTKKESLIKQYGFSEADFEQFKLHGIALDKMERELLLFQSGIPKIYIEKPATINDGILKLTTNEFHEYADEFDRKKTNLKVQKFVPASGAASRMFNFLTEFLNEFDRKSETINAYINRKKDKNLPVFLAGIEKFPFYEEVKSKLKEIKSDYYLLESNEKSFLFIKTMLALDHFDYSNKPKGILAFHKYDTHISTPVDEHLKECSFYASSNSIAFLHFTVSENHRQLFENAVAKAKEDEEKRYGIKSHVSFSSQHKSTDTIAVNMQNKPFRNLNGELVFRPGGHGALINNLNELDADLIFIKNIDNVIQNHIDEITLYKKGLAGILLDLQQQIFKILTDIDNKNITEINIPNIISFLAKKLNIIVFEAFTKFTLDNKIDYIKNQLNRPIRVCGMVINEGEPGGGPFWIRSSKGNVSLQIVESSQVDKQNSKQVEVLQKSTHFNPVDLVCAIKNYKGEKFDLLQFVDPETGFIVNKNSRGIEIKGYELPGLWNGAMAHWITIFVEVPLVTFNPVKTVNDLLKPAHQPQYEA